MNLMLNEKKKKKELEREREKGMAFNKRTLEKISV